MRWSAALGLAGMLSGRAAPPARARKRKPKPTYTCPSPAETLVQGSGDVRFAQSFTALRGGTLRQIKVPITKPAGTEGDYVVQLVKLVGGLPSNNPVDVLAAATIANTQVPNGESTLVAKFATTRIDANTDYAVVVSRPGTGNLAVASHIGGNDCPGDMFQANAGSVFQKISAPEQDMLVTVLVD